MPIDISKVGTLSYKLMKTKNFFALQNNSYGLSKLAKFSHFSNFLFDLQRHIDIRSRHDRPHFRIARNLSYNFFFGCLYRRFEKYGRKNCFLTSSPKFLWRWPERSIFSHRFTKFPSNMVKSKVIAHKASNIFPYQMTHFSWKILVMCRDRQWTISLCPKKSVHKEKKFFSRF